MVCQLAIASGCGAMLVHSSAGAASGAGPLASGCAASGDDGFGGDIIEVTSSPQPKIKSTKSARMATWIAIAWPAQAVENAPPQRKPRPSVCTQRGQDPGSQAPEFEMEFRRLIQEPRGTDRCQAE